MMAENPMEPESPPPRRGLGFGNLINIVRRHHWLLIIPLLVIPLAVVIGMRFIVPVYESYVIISVGEGIRLITPLEDLLGFDPELATQITDTRETRQALRQEITSPANLKEVVEVLDLKLDQSSLKPVMELLRAAPRENPEQVAQNLMIEKIRKNISVSIVGENHIKIRVRYDNPHQARDIAANVAEVFIRENLRQRLGAARQTENFSTGQLEKYESAYREKLTAQTALESEMALIRLDTMITGQENLRNLTLDIETTRNEALEAENEVERLRERYADIPDGVETSLEQNGEITAILKEIRNLHASYSDLVWKHRWQSPSVFGVKNTIQQKFRSLEAIMGQELAAKGGNPDADTRKFMAAYFSAVYYAEIQKSQLNALTGAQRRLRDRMELLVDYQARYDNLIRETAAARDLRDRFLSQQEGDRLSQAVLRESEYKIVQQATLGLNPVRPDKPRLVIWGVILGLLTGIGGVISAELFDTTFKKTEDIEKRLGLPVMGVIPAIQKIRESRIGL